MEDLETIKEVNKKADVTMTKQELIDKLKTFFNLDEIEIYGNMLYVNSTYESHLFTYQELKPIFDLANMYNFKISFLEKSEYRDYTHIAIDLEDSFIIL